MSHRPAERFALCRALLYQNAVPGSQPARRLRYRKQGQTGCQTPFSDVGAA